MKLKKFGTTEQRIYELVRPIVTGMDYTLWDVRYEKEGASWYLRIFIDTPDGYVDISDCERVTAPVSDLLDETDPIDQSYILEVSSAGLEADLVRENHFEASIGLEVRVRSIRPCEDGSREVIGVLQSWDKTQLTLSCRDGEHTYPMESLAVVKLFFDFDN